MMNSVWPKIGKLVHSLYLVSLTLLVVVTVTGILASANSLAPLKRRAVAQTTIQVDGQTLIPSNPINAPNGELLVDSTIVTHLDGNVNYVVEAQGCDVGGCAVIDMTWIKLNNIDPADPDTADPSTYFAYNKGSFALANWPVGSTQAASPAHNPGAGVYDYEYLVAEGQHTFTFKFQDNEFGGSSYISTKVVSVDHPPTPLRNLVVNYDAVSYTATITFKNPWQFNNGYIPSKEIIIRRQVGSAAFVPVDGTAYPSGISKDPITGVYTDAGLQANQQYIYEAWAYDDGLKYSRPVAETLTTQPPLIVPPEGCESWPVANPPNPPEIIAGGTIRFTCSLPDALIPKDLEDNPQLPTSIKLEIFKNNGSLSESRSMYYLNRDNYSIKLSKNQRDPGQDSIEFRSDPGFTFTFYLNSLPPADPNTVLTNMVAGLHTLDFKIIVNDNPTLSANISNRYGITWRVKPNLPVQFNENYDSSCPFTTFDLLGKDYQYPANVTWDMPNWSACNLNSLLTFLEDAIPSDRCGNGWIEETEVCDDGNDIDKDACNNSCQKTICGDGVIQDKPKNSTNISEQCEPPGQSLCSNSCQLLVDLPASCGNGLLDDPSEECDAAGPSATCDAYCQEILPDAETAVCGNGVQEGTEQCDDFNQKTGDGCSASCQLEQLPRCGDGTINQATEQCDDGAASLTCNSSCQLINQPVGPRAAVCGDIVAGINGNFACIDPNQVCDLVANICKSTAP